MIVTYKEDLVGGPRHRKVSTGTSLRMLTREDGVGFSFHDTELKLGLLLLCSTRTTSKPTTSSTAQAN